jgi:hypothetical protein
MAQKVSVVLEDDLDGGPADETVRFGLGGTEYEIDLNKKNASAFRKQLAPFIEHARKAGPGRSRRAARTAATHTAVVARPGSYSLVAERAARSWNACRCRLGA